VLFGLASIIAPAASAQSRLINLSNRSLLSGGQVLTGGLSVGGTTPETVLIRAVGPSLGSFGVSNPLSDPTLTVFDSSGSVIAGPVSNWNASDAATMSGVGAFALTSGSHDAATVMTLNPGTYTVQVKSAGGNSGVALLESYEVNGAATRSILNLSTTSAITSASNGNVATGFVVSGTSNRTLLIRAIGPGLWQFNVGNAVPNPGLELLDANGNVLAQNDDWGRSVSGGVTAAQLTTAFAQVGAFSLNATSEDAAILVNVSPGLYTVNVTGNGGTGTVLTELYDVTAAGGTPSTDTVVTTQSGNSNPPSNDPPVATPPVVTPPVVTPPVVIPPVVIPPTSVSGTGAGTPSGDYVDDTELQLPPVGSSILHVLTPNVVELELINTVPQGSSAVTSLNFVSSSGVITAPAAGEFTVSVGGQTVSVSSVHFKRRVLYAPLNTYDLRVMNCIYLTLSSSAADNQTVTVTNPDQSLWPTGQTFTAVTDPLRYSPAIHVNQEGYVPEFTKQAMVGFYLGDGGEMSVAAGTPFNVVDASTSAVVYSGTLSAQPGDVGYTTNPLPYQHVLMADFSSYQTPGQYYLEVQGLGASLPFLINEGIAMAWTRTYALGMYEQRSGMAVSMPFTRFTHAADHTAPALVPVPDTSSQFSFTWNCIKGYATTVNTNNAPQVAPFLTNNETSLYPYVNTGTINTTGGHFDAGDYSKYTENSAQLVHELIFAVDNVPGMKTFDNLGIPESGDGIPDVLQEAKWEADYLVKLQDADGGFYFLVYPLNREYEGNVLPENGDQQVVWPKNTSVSAAATAALAEAGSSPAMKKYYPQQAAGYLAAAQKGWQFLTAATAAHGANGRYQKITFYSDNWTDKDEYAWASAALFAATGDATYSSFLEQTGLPDPTDSSTFRWGWWRMAEGYGNAVRAYAFAVRSGRLQASQLDSAYLAKCEQTIVNAGNDAVTWVQDNPYGSPFPPATKAVLGGGWYFSLDQATDMVTAYLVSPSQNYINGLVSAMNYEGGTNPNNVCYLEGLGMKRQQQVVSQYAQNSRRVLAPSGFVVGQVTAAYEYLNEYGSLLSNLSYPTDSGNGVTYPYYDRWSDAYNVTNEQITVNLARSMISVGFLASLTNVSGNAWVAPSNASIALPSSAATLGQPAQLTVSVPGQDMTNARIVWEARDQSPAFGSTFSDTPVNVGDQWVEAEVEWPDGRRAFAIGDFQAAGSNQVWIDDALPANTTTTSDGGDSWNWVSSSPSPHSGARAFQSSGSSGEHSLTFANANGSMEDTETDEGKQGSLAVQTGDTLYAWVYLDPSSPPTELMICWNDSTGNGEHRAYWGANSIAWGNNNSASRFNVGALPAMGQWVQISVPASAVGLEGQTVVGMSFAAYNGKVTWDAIGRANGN
jgi:hypothetical protein